MSGYLAWLMLTFMWFAILPGRSRPTLRIKQPIAPLPIPCQEFTKQSNTQTHFGPSRPFSTPTKLCAISSQL